MFPEGSRTGGCTNSVPTRSLAEPIFNKLLPLFYYTMAPTRRSERLQKTPEPETILGEATTVKRTRFFNAYSEKSAEQSFRAFCRSFPVNHSTGRK